MRHGAPSTPIASLDAFLARLALEDFEARSPTIQMALQAELARSGAPVELRPVVKDADWGALLGLVLANHGERSRGDDLDLPPEFSRQMVEVYRAKGGAYRFHLAIEDGAPVAYAAAPNGAGMIEDLFTLPSARRRGVATGMIAEFAKRLGAAGCHTIFHWRERER